MEEKKRLRHFLLVLVCTVSAVVIVCFLVAQVSRVQSSSEDGEIANASLSDLLKAGMLKHLCVQIYLRIFKLEKISVNVIFPK